MSDTAAVFSPATTTQRPLLIDENDGPCEICRAHVNGICDGCGVGIPVYPQMGGNGYQSVTPTHFHLLQIEGINGRRSKHAELCLECYRTHRKGVYPNETWEPSN